MIKNIIIIIIIIIIILLVQFFVQVFSYSTETRWYDRPNIIQNSSGVQICGNFAAICKENTSSRQINSTLQTADSKTQAYYTHKGLMTSKLINKYTNNMMYKALRGPAVTYAWETWAFSVRNINTLLVFETQILRRIYRPVQCKEGWRIRSNNELQKLIKGKDIVKYIKAQSIKWCGRLNRMEDIKLVKKITGWKPIGVRTKA